MIPTKKPLPQKPQSTVSPSQPTPAEPELPDETASTGRVWIWIVLGVLVAAGVIFFLVSKSGKESSKAEEAAEEAAPKEAYEQLVEDVNDEAEEEMDEIEIPEATLEEILETEKFIEEIEEATPAEAVSEEEAPAKEAPYDTDFDRGTEDLHIVRSHERNAPAPEAPAPRGDEVFTSVEQMPQFPGGEGELLKYISSHIKYPMIAQENGVQGRVVVKFVVKKDGSIGEVKVVRGKDPDLDKEAVRVVKTLPKFIPGKMNGQPVNVWYTLPINFRL